MAKINEMCYTEFTEHLKNKGISFKEEEGVDIDYWFEAYVAVIPTSKTNIKERCFSLDGGYQLK